jgi:hypothetical protein
MQGIRNERIRLNFNVCTSEDKLIKSSIKGQGNNLRLKTESGSRF